MDEPILPLFVIGIQRFSFLLESKASALGPFGVQSFSFGSFWSPKLQLWVLLESKAEALGPFGVQS
jgi:hypothetical protein